MAQQKSFYSQNFMDPDKFFFSHEFLADFIDEFKKYPSLWDSKSRDFVNNQERHKSWEQLQIYCESIIGCVDLEWLKRKVHSMKGSFNKELKKMKDARRSGFTGEWIPKLWYFENLLFTKSHMIENLNVKKELDEGSESGQILMQTGDRYGEDEEGTNGWTAHNEETNSTAETDPEIASHSEEQNDTPHAFSTGAQDDDRISRKRKLGRSTNHTTYKRRPPLENVQVELGKPEDVDVYEAIGKVVASKLRALANLDYTQFIRTDKLINDAIYKGFQKQLTPDCEVVAERKLQHSTHPTTTDKANTTNLSPFPHQTYNLYFPQNLPSPSLQSQSHPSSVSTTGTTSAPSSRSPSKFSAQLNLINQPPTEITCDVDVVPHEISQ